MPNNGYIVAHGIQDSQDLSALDTPDTTRRNTPPGIRDRDSYPDTFRVSRNTWYQFTTGSSRPNLTTHLSTQGTRRLTSAQVMVGSVLAGFADWKTGRRIWPSMSTVAARSGLSVRQVRRHVRSLEQAGLLRHDSRRTKANGAWVDTYSLALPSELLEKLSTQEVSTLAQEAFATTSGEDVPDAGEDTSDRQERTQVTAGEDTFDLRPRLDATEKMAPDQGINSFMSEFFEPLSSQSTNQKNHNTNRTDVDCPATTRSLRSHAVPGGNGHVPHRPHDERDTTSDDTASHPELPTQKPGNDDGTVDGGSPLAPRFLFGGGATHSLGSVISEVRTASGDTGEETPRPQDWTTEDAKRETRRFVATIANLFPHLGGLKENRKIRHAVATIGAAGDSLAMAMAMDPRDNLGKLEGPGGVVALLSRHALTPEWVRAGSERFRPVGALGF